MSEPCKSAARAKACRSRPRDPNETRERHHTHTYTHSTRHCKTQIQHGHSHRHIRTHLLPFGQAGLAVLDLLHGQPEAPPLLLPLAEAGQVLSVGKGSEGEARREFRSESNQCRAASKYNPLTHTPFIPQISIGRYLDRLLSNHPRTSAPARRRRSRACPASHSPPTWPCACPSRWLWYHVCDGWVSYDGTICVADEQLTPTDGCSTASASKQGSNRKPTIRSSIRVVGAEWFDVDWKPASFGWHASWHR